MPKTFLPLTAMPLRSGITYSNPSEPPEVLHWEDPAMLAMVDFRYLKAITISPDEAIDNAVLGVKNSVYHALLVVNKEHHILGTITAEDLLGEKPLKVIQERRIARADLVVRMVMTPQNEILALDLENLRHAKVGHIIETLRAHKQHYALVVKIDEKTHAHTVRGLFSSALLSKQLGQDVLSEQPLAHSLAELHHDLHLND